MENAVPGESMACGKCGARAGTGRIFCPKCGTPIRTSVPLIQVSEDAAPPPTGAVKRTVIWLIKGIAVISAVAFGLCPFRTGTQVLIFVASIAVLLICHFALCEVDDTYTAKGSGGYWPQPLDWGRPAKGDDANNEDVIPKPGS